MKSIALRRLTATIAVIAALVAACEEKPKAPLPPFEIRAVTIDGRAEWSAFFRPAPNLAPEKLLFEAARGAIVELNQTGDRLARLACPGGMEPCDLQLWAARAGDNRYRHTSAAIEYYPHEPAFQLQWQSKLVLRLYVRAPLTTLVVTAAGYQSRFDAKSVPPNPNVKSTRVPHDDLSGAYDLVHDEMLTLTEVRPAP